MPEMDPIAYSGLLLLGAANLVPWMAFLSLSDYFTTLYHSNAMEFWFPAFSTSALIASSATLLFVGSSLSFNARIAVPTLFMALLMLVVPAVDVARAYRAARMIHLAQARRRRAGDSRWRWPRAAEAGRGRGGWRPWV